MGEPFSLTNVMPDDQLEAQGWMICLKWAAGGPQVLKHFREETEAPTSRARPSLLA